ncbi:MAG: hypothetical protein HIU88_10110 [Acidobacteria bacterium]|nr:hypothetical protein [Acidobacteriota bacterium]
MSVEIGGRLYSWTQPQCERCWAERNGGEYGPWNAPVRVRDHAAERCAFCGYPTWAGIFVRVDPRNVEWPTSEPAPELDTENAP